MVDRREVGGALRAPPDRVGELLGRTRSRQGADLWSDARAGLEQPGFVQRQRGAEVREMLVAVGRADQHRLEGELARPVRLVAGQAARDRFRELLVHGSHAFLLPWTLRARPS
jgi:hypothetical protein